MAGTIQLFYAPNPTLKKPVYSTTRQTEQHQRNMYALFDVPLTIAIGKSEQSFVEYLFAFVFSQEIGQPAINLLGFDRKPQILLVGDEAKEEHQPNEGLWSIGSPYRNPLTRLLASDQGGVQISGLDSSLRQPLPYSFAIKDDTVESRGYYALSERDDALKIFVENAAQTFNRDEKGATNLSLEDAVVQEPLVKIKGDNQHWFIPRYDSGLKSFTTDYFIIAQTDTVNPRAREFGQHDVIIAGCYDLGTWAAIKTLFDEELIDKIKKEVRGADSFQVIGRVSGPDIDLLEIIRITRA